MTISQLSAITFQTRLLLGTLRKEARVKSSQTQTLALAQLLVKAPQGTDWTRAHGLIFDEYKHRWVHGETGEEATYPISADELKAGDELIVSPKARIAELRGEVIEVLTVSNKYVKVRVGDRTAVLGKNTLERWIEQGAIATPEPPTVDVEETYADKQSVTNLELTNGELQLPGDRKESRRETQREWRELPDVQPLPESAWRYYNYEYRELNESLRNGDEMDEEDEITYRGMKHAMRPTVQDHLMYRGWRNNPGFARPQIGEVISSPQFLSTTTDPHYAIQWSSYNSTTGEVYKDNPLWQIRVPKGTSGLMAHDFETELTLDTNVSLKCVGVREVPVASTTEDGPTFYSRYVYDMEVVLDE